MKNFLIFIAGMVTMFIILLLIGLVNQFDGDSYPGLTIFEEDGTCVDSTKQVEIFQTLEPDIALAHTQKKKYDYFVNEILVLILGDENTHFYDNQRIIIPNGKCVKQVGTYQYKTKNGDIKTVPAVEIK